MGRKPLLTLWEQEKRRLQPLLLRFTTNLTIYGKAGARCTSLIDCEMGGLLGSLPDNARSAFRGGDSRSN